MTPFKENSGIHPTMTLPLSVINKIKINPNFFFNLNILNKKKIKNKKNFKNFLFFFTPPPLYYKIRIAHFSITLKLENIALQIE